MPGARVLDLGVGSGAAALAAGGRGLVGLDRSGEMLRRAAATARRAGRPLVLVHGDALALPFRPGALDGALAHSVLYLLPDPAGALRELYRAVRRGGRVAVLEPRAGPVPWRGFAEVGARAAASMLLWRGMSRLHRRFDEAGLVALLEGAGFVEARASRVLGGFGVVASATRP